MPFTSTSTNHWTFLEGDMKLGKVAPSTKGHHSNRLSWELLATNTPSSWGMSASIVEEGDLGASPIRH